MNFITLYFPSYSSLAQPLKLFWTQSTVLPTHCTFRNRDITYKSPFTAKHYLRFIRAKSLPSAAMKVLLLFLKGFQLFAAGVAMPHKHAAKAQTDSEKIPLLSSCPEVLHKCHFDTLTSSTHIWARRRLCPSPQHTHITAAQHTRAVRGSPDQQATVPWVQHTCFMLNHLSIHLFSMGHTPNVHQASLYGGGAPHGFQPNRQSPVLCCASALTNPGNTVGVSGCLREQGRSTHSSYPVWNTYQQISSPTISTPMKLGEGRGSKEEKGGKTTTVCLFNHLYHHRHCIYTF